MRKIKDSERIAKLVVESVVPGATMSYRDRQANGEHDYDLMYPSRLVVPVEVTESRDFQIESAVAVLDTERFVKAKACRRDWYVHPLRDARIKRYGKRWTSTSQISSRKDSTGSLPLEMLLGSRV
jgi:hypothetical protein